MEPPAQTESPVAKAVQGLVVVDMQAGFVTGPAAVPSASELTPAVEMLISRARATGAVVIHLRNAGPPAALDEPGTPTWQLYSPTVPGDIVLDKTADDGFINTTLAKDLEEHGVQRLAICGVMSEMCVAATARAALERGYGVVLAHDAHGTYDVPAGPGGSPPVPAALAARAAEWSLGDTVEIVASADLVSFASS